MACQFYGYCALPGQRLLLPSMGNQCAMVTEATAPCLMECPRDRAIKSQPPDWDKCPLNDGGKRAELVKTFTRVVRVR